MLHRPPQEFEHGGALRIFGVLEAIRDPCRQAVLPRNTQGLLPVPEDDDVLQMIREQHLRREGRRREHFQRLPLVIGDEVQGPRVLEHGALGIRQDEGVARRGHPSGCPSLVVLGAAPPAGVGARASVSSGFVSCAERSPRTLRDGALSSFARLRVVETGEQVGLGERLVWPRKSTCERHERAGVTV